VDKLKILRGEAVNQGEKLLNDLRLAQGDIGAMARVLWEHEANIQEETIDLLQKLQRLQAAHNDLHSKLTALEFRLYDVAESQPS